MNLINFTAHLNTLSNISSATVLTNQFENNEIHDVYS